MCNPLGIDEPNDNKNNDIDKFAAFMRDTKAPAPDPFLKDNSEVKRGNKVFEEIQCNACHKESWQTSKRLDGTPTTHPEFLQGKTIFPYSDFLVHDVGTGDGIAVSITEHYGFERDKLKNVTVEYNENCDEAERPPAARP